MAVRKKSADAAQRLDALGRLATANAGMAQGLFAIAHSGLAPEWSARYRSLAGRVVRTGVGLSDRWTRLRDRAPPALEALQAAADQAGLAVDALVAANAGPTTTKLGRAYELAGAARLAAQRLLQHVEE